MDFAGKDVVEDYAFYNVNLITYYKNRVGVNHPLYYCRLQTLGYMSFDQQLIIVMQMLVADMEEFLSWGCIQGLWVQARHLIVRNLKIPLTVLTSNFGLRQNY